MGRMEEAEEEGEEMEGNGGEMTDQTFLAIPSPKDTCDIPHSSCLPQATE